MRIQHFRRFRSRRPFGTQKGSKTDPKRGDQRSPFFLRGSLGSRWTIVLSPSGRSRSPPEPPWRLQEHPKSIQGGPRTPNYLPRAPKMSPKWPRGLILSLSSLFSSPASPLFSLLFSPVYPLISLLTSLFSLLSSLFSLRSSLRSTQRRFGVQDAGGGAAPT